jgi:hypothetical protein
MQPIVRSSLQPQTADCWRPDDEAHRGRDEDGAAVVDRSALARLRGLGLRGEDQRDDGDRDVDPEDGAPRPLGEVAAGERADGGQAAGDAEEERERAAALPEREGGDDDRQRGGEEQRGERALGDAEGDHPRLAVLAGRGRAAERRADGEPGHADGQHAAMTEHVGQLAAEGEEGGQREQVSVDDPLGAGRGEREVVLQARHGEGDDRLVDEHHRHGEDHRDEDEALVGGGGRGGGGRRSAHRRAPWAGGVDATCSTIPPARPRAFSRPVLHRARRAT